MKEIRVIKTKDDNIHSLIDRVFKLWMKSKKQILNEFGLSSPQYEVLSAIYDLSNLKQRIIQIDLSEETGINPMTTSTILRYLEKIHLITRVRGEVNTRVIFIELTDEGESVYNMASDKMSSCCNNLYRDIDEKSFAEQLLVLFDELDNLNKQIQ